MIASWVDDGHNVRWPVAGMDGTEVIQKLKAWMVTTEVRINTLIYLSLNTEIPDLELILGTGFRCDSKQGGETSS